VANTLSRMLNITEENGVSDQITNVTFFLLQLVQFQEIFEYLIAGKFSIHYS
jgi:hypothetical protein